MASLGETPSMSPFDDFIQTLKRFERQLFGLVISSFFFSSVLTIVEYRHFDAGFMALTSLVAGVMGIAAVLSQYVGSLGNVRRKVDDLLLFEPERSASNVSATLVLAVLSLGGFYYFAVNGDRTCLLFASASTFLFFRALASALLTIEQATEQERVWHNMPADERNAWIDRHVERLEREFAADQIERGVTHQFQEMLEESRRRSRESGRSLSEFRRRVREGKRAQWRLRWRHRFDRVHLFSINARRRLAGERLVLTTERLKLAGRDKRMNDRLNERRGELARKAYRNIKDGRSVLTRIEGSGIVIHQPEGFGWQCMLIDRSIDEADARTVVHDVSVLRDEKSGQLPAVAMFVEPGAEVSLQARKLFETEGLRLYWVSSWQEQPPQNAG